MTVMTVMAEDIAATTNVDGNTCGPTGRKRSAVSGLRRGPDPARRAWNEPARGVRYCSDSPSAPPTAMTHFSLTRSSSEAG